MITIQQVKAARALLDWTQTDLATQSGLSLASIANIEQGKGKTRGKSMDSLRGAFEQNGIEFTPDPGVRLRREKFQMQLWEGEESVPRLWLDIEQTLGLTGGEVLMSGIEEALWLKRYPQSLLEAVRRRWQMGIRGRLLVAEGDNLVLVGVEGSRAISPILFNQTPYLVYGDKFAIVTWGPPQYVLCVQNKLIADTFRRQFEYNWQNGKPLRREDCVIIKVPGIDV